MKRLEDGIGFNVSRLARLLKSNWSEALEDLGIAPPHAAILRTIHEANGDIGLREVARRLGTDPMNVKRGIDFLEEIGLIASNLADRGKPRLLSLTSKGVLTVEEITKRIVGQERLFQECLTRDEIVNFLTALVKVQDYLHFLEARRGNLES